MRHTHTTVYNDRTVIVAMGFDIPLQGYFMTVEPKNVNNPDADEDTGMIYSNLDDPELKKTRGYTKDIEGFKKLLRDMKIIVPASFFATVLAD